MEYINPMPNMYARERADRSPRRYPVQDKGLLLGNYNAIRGRICRGNLYTETGKLSGKWSAFIEYNNSKDEICVLLDATKDGQNMNEHCLEVGRVFGRARDERVPQTMAPLDEGDHRERHSRYDGGQNCN
ncbi:hypothetical protein C8Q73DRAFT_120120 [Cubamyces lactineus]|nr:hypothetical protein C8Q73DRAFT_120120 [Cubamyces lactineus]